MEEKTTKLYDLLNIAEPLEVYAEVKAVIALMTAELDCDQLCRDIVALFNGKYPGYQASKTKYHDLEHTNSVALATARLLHGCTLEGAVFSSRGIFLGIAAALFHDTGLIQKEIETDGTGARFTIGHEQRSIDFMQEYLSVRGYSTDDIQDCSHLIRTTILNLPFKEIPFRTEEIETIGKIVGSADLLAQIADRNYLEKLILLFKEFEEANISGFGSEIDLLQKTDDFYALVAKKRLEQDLGGVSAAMVKHFRNRWNIDRDLYQESIRRNIDYLKSLVQVCTDDFECYLDNLRRIDISKKRNA